jgi:hypothetical protein
MIRLFRVFVPVGTITLEILLITSAFVLAAYLVFLFYDGGMMRILLVLLCILVGLHFQDLYSQYFVKSRIALLTRGAQ